MAERIQIKDYRVKVNLKCWDGIKRTTKGYPVIFRGFRKYKFAVHRQWGNDEKWRVTELSTGLAFKSWGKTRLEVVGLTYKSLIKNKDEFKRKVP